MNTRAPDIQKNLGLRSMMIPTIAVIGEILATCYIMCPSGSLGPIPTDVPWVFASKIKIGVWLKK
jgi:hypothetical protein